MAKQTGRRYAVKPAGALALGICATFFLTGCAAEAWRNSHKTPVEAKADHKTCNAQAEDATLTRARKQRADYTALPPGAMQPGYSRGETPVQLAERGANEKDFARQFADCMESKGYNRGDDKDKLP